MKTYHTLTQTLQKAGMRITPQRIAICQLLVNSVEHPTAMSIYEMLKADYPSLSLATIYNTLDVLVALGSINVLGSIGDDKVHFDADTIPHINLACVKCHKITDVSSDYVEKMNSEITENSGFHLLGSRVLYYGICPDCQKSE